MDDDVMGRHGSELISPRQEDFPREPDVDWGNSVHWSERLRRRLRVLRLTQAALARRSGVSKELVRKYASGAVANPRGDILPKLAKALGCDLVWLEYGVTVRKCCRCGDLVATDQRSGK